MRAASGGISTSARVRCRVDEVISSSAAASSASIWAVDSLSTAQDVAVHRRRRTACGSASRRRHNTSASDPLSGTSRLRHVLRQGRRQHSLRRRGVVRAALASYVAIYFMVYIDNAFDAVNVDLISHPTAQQ